MWYIEFPRIEATVTVILNCSFQTNLIVYSLHATNMILISKWMYVHWLLKPNLLARLRSWNGRMLLWCFLLTSRGTCAVYRLEPLGGRAALWCEHTGSVGPVRSQWGRLVFRSPPFYCLDANMFCYILTYRCKFAWCEWNWYSGNTS